MALEISVSFLIAEEQADPSTMGVTPILLAFRGKCE
jgi:hypothetical protein